MGYSITEKIIKSHLISGDMTPGEEICLKIDQTLTQDATGTMAYLQFEAMGVPRVKTGLSVAYVDHNMLQSGFENADDHRYIGSAAKKYGLYFSRPGNGVCHQVHLERFGVPGTTLIGSDSHTPTAGGIGQLAFGAGGLEVAYAMGTTECYIIMPKVVRINLKGRLKPFVSAKDIILEVLRRLSVKGGVGSVMEYSGGGIASLSVPQRATITNMGAELGATSSVFPSDDVTRKFLKAQGREEDYAPLFADPDALYDSELTIDLSALEPLAACPHSPDNVKPVSILQGTKIDQVCIGSCTNSSLADMKTAAAILKGKTIAENVSLVIAPGSRQVLSMLADSGDLQAMIDAGARVAECACGPCIGMGHSPNSAGISLRTFNRNFEGRSGTKDAGVYLVSPETAAVSALCGVFTDPTELDSAILTAISDTESFQINDNMIVPPLSESETAAVEVVRGPNIKPFPVNTKLPDSITAPVLLKLGDNITTDHIMPAGSKILPLRSNIPAISEFCFSAVDAAFAARAKAANGGFIIAGTNYGQGSSREHAVLAPLYLGIKAVIAVSFARIHRQNLIGNGIVPLVFKNSDALSKISQGDMLELLNIRTKISDNNNSDFALINKTTGETIELSGDFSARQREHLLAGGLLLARKN